MLKIKKNFLLLCTLSSFPIFFLTFDLGWPKQSTHLLIILLFYAMKWNFFQKCTVSDDKFTKLIQTCIGQ